VVSNDFVSRNLAFHRFRDASWFASAFFSQPFSTVVDLSAS